MSDVFFSTLRHPLFWRYVAVISGCLWVGLSIWERIGNILPPFLIGMLGAYVLDTPVRFIMKSGISRTFASLGVFLGIFIVFLFLVFAGLPYIQEELSTFVDSFPKAIDRWFSTFSPVWEDFAKAHSLMGIVDLKKQVTHYVGDVVRWGIGFLIDLISHGGRVATFLSFMVVTPIILFYLLKDWPLFVGFMSRTFVPSRYKSFATSLNESLNHTLKEYLKGQTLLSLCLCALYTFSLVILGLPKAVLVGMLSGVLSFIPYLGLTIGLLLSLSLAFAEADPWSMTTAIIIIYGVIAFIEGYILGPRLVGRKLGLHPGVILLALFVGGAWLGFLGVALAVPVSGMIRSALLTFKKYNDLID